jgi:hypothetical protein
MLQDKLVAVVLGIGLLLSLVSTFGSDEGILLLAALFD